MHRDSQCIVGSLTIKQTTACLAARTLTVKMLWNGGRLIMNASVFIRRVLLFPYRGIMPTRGKKNPMRPFEFKRNAFIFKLVGQYRGILTLFQIDATHIKIRFEDLLTS